ncbi:putative bromodomain-containing protein [Cucumis melo var. makuwa]|uniref:Bromodomain-containing protein n=1 Tax=Cucumis melo var. makuwa TaxID=1194695 RepID=A0A5A7VIS8_CUCMM|nr:putative bromodomain-containing protein [Cucumis melo var. makuwa]TYK07200.1 putative bromodomain-containing protein [Cucumis melo var. makuwa]
MLCWSRVGKASPDAIHGVGKASPDRLYRAALLRNRCADTILKAREKALEKGDKRDPEKVRMEREELERQQREGWRRAMDGRRLKLKLRSRRRTTTTMKRTRRAMDDDKWDLPTHYLRRQENLGLGNIPYFPREAFPDALLMTSGIPFISQRLVPDT